jgi:hypothetical protein
MPQKYKNGRDAKKGDPVVGPGWRGETVCGTVDDGDAEQGHPELVIRHGVTKHLCPSLTLEHFLHADDAAGGGSKRNPSPNSGA